MNDPKKRPTVKVTESVKVTERKVRIQLSKTTLDSGLACRHSSGTRFARAGRTIR